MIFGEEEEDGDQCMSILERQMDLADEGDPGLNSLLIKGLFHPTSPAPSNALQLFDPSVVMSAIGGEYVGQRIPICVKDLQFIKQIGQGHHGVIFSARHVPTGKLMAIKEIPIETAGIDFKQVIAELSVLSKSSSPHIINFYGCFLHNTSVFLCLELMDIGSLSRLIKHQRGQPIPSPVLAAIAYQVIIGMEFLRTELHMAHRGEVKLCDFGISTSLLRSVGGSLSSGTLCYMADDVHMSATADVWSLGASLFQAAMSEPLFNPDNYDGPFAHMMAVMQDANPSIPPDRCSDSMASFIYSCLVKDPLQRPDCIALLNHEAVASFTQTDFAIQTIADWLSSLDIRPYTHFLL